MAQKYNLLMLSGDTALVKGEHGAFYQTLKRFSQYWNRIDVIVPPAKGATQQTVFENVYLHPSPWHLVVHPLFIWRKGRELLRQRHYDLIVSHDFGVFYNGVGAALLKFRRDIPLVSEIHHVEGHPFALTRKEFIYKTLATWYIRWAKHRVAAFRVVNRNEIPAYLREFTVPEEKILILPSMYIDFEIFHPMPTIEKQYDVLFVGRFAPNKGILRLLDALHIVKKTYPQLTCCLMGRGELETQIQDKIRDLSLDDVVTIIPSLETAQDVAKLYNQANTLVCASTSEGGPRVTVEAMACGTAVISTPVGIMKDLMEDGKNFLVSGWHADELARNISLLLKDDLLREQVAENGELAVQGFRADDIIHQYANGYIQLIEQHQQA